MIVDGKDVSAFMSHQDEGDEKLKMQSVESRFLSVRRRAAKHQTMKRKKEAWTIK